MVEIKIRDKYTKEEYVEDNYEYLYATLMGLRDIAIKRHDYIRYNENTIEKEFLQEAVMEVNRRLKIFNYDVAKKVYKYFYYTVPVIVNNYYVYIQRGHSLDELRKLAGINISRPRKRRVSKIL